MFDTSSDTRLDKTTPAAQDDPRMDTPLRKHAAVIHINGDLSLLQRKLFNVLLMNCYDDLDRKDWFELPIDTLAMLLNFNSKNLSYLDEAARKLRGTEITFNLLNDRGFEQPTPRSGDGPTRGFTGLISSWVEDGRIRRYEISRLLARQLKSPKVFASINLRIQSKFSSAYALHLYENTVRFRDVKSTGYWDLQLLRKLLGTEAEASYDDFRKFRVRAIDKAIQEINAFSDIEVTPEYKTEKVGRARRVVAVRFKIKDRAPLTVTQAVPQAVAMSAGFQQLRELGVANLLASRVIADEGEQRALEIVRYTKQRMATGKVKSPGAYASKLIKQRAELVQEAEPAARSADSDKVRIERDQSIEQTHRQQRRDKLRRQFEAERRTTAFASISDAEMQQYLDAFVEDAKVHRPHVLRGYDPQTRELSGMTKIAFELLVVREVLGDYTDAQLDEWIARRRGATGELFSA